MPFSRNWALVDVFTLDQAACLWCDSEPYVLEHRSNIPGNITAVLQAMVGASKRGELNLDHSTNPMAQIGNLHKSLVSRDALARFARSKNQFPAFLFDAWDDATLPAQEPRAPARGDAVLESEAAQSSVGDPPRSVPPGRPQEYDWNSCFGEIVRLADMDGLPGTQAELVRHLIGWFEERFGKSPADSVLKSKTSHIYQYLRHIGWKSRSE